MMSGNSAHGIGADHESGQSPARLMRLIARIDSAPLFAHAYSHHLNLRFGAVTPFDLLRFAANHGLRGLKIHAEDGEQASLLNMTGPRRKDFGRAAAGLELILHVETSSTTRHDLEAAVAIARDTGAQSIRCYPRYEGHVSEIMSKAISDLRQLREIDPQGQFRFTLEQHEDLKSPELVAIVQAVDNPRLSLLFDFGNMINAFERSAGALAIQAPLVTEAHIKDVKIVADRGGWAHLACQSGEGDIDFHTLLRDLLLLGEDAPQVTALALEEENGMYAPAYRFPGEPADPFIPARAASTTDLPDDERLEHRLEREREEASQQIHYVRKVLGELRAEATAQLQNDSAAKRKPSASGQGVMTV